jgi:hypothetical protein
MSNRQSSSGFPWIWILIPTCLNALRGLEGIAKSRPGFEVGVLVFVAFMVVLVILAIVKLAAPRARAVERRRRDPPPPRLDPLWDDQLDRYPY